MKGSTIRKWEKIIEDYEESGLSVKEYCEKNGVNKNTLTHRLQDFKSMSNQINEVVVVKETIDVEPIDLTINGVKLQFDRSLDETVLKTIIKACGNL